MGRKGKLTPEQLKRRRRNIFLNEITPEWRAYEVEQYRIQDEFEDAVRRLEEEHRQVIAPFQEAYLEKYLQAFDACRASKIAVPVPVGPLWLKGKEPHIKEESKNE